jgi:hypothetical protein
MISARRRNSYRRPIGIRHRRIAIGCKLHAPAIALGACERATARRNAQDAEFQQLTLLEVQEEIARHSGTRFA